MTPHDMHDLERRVAILERALRDAHHEIRRSRRSRFSVRTIATIVIGLAATLALVDFGEAQGSGQSVTAPFVVVDASGKEILRVSVDGGQPRLQLRNSAGAAVVTLGGNALGAGRMVVTDSGGNRQIELQSKNGPAGVFIYNKGAAPRTQLYIGERGTAGVASNDNAGNLVAMVIANNQNRGQLSVHSSDRIGGLIAKSGEVHLELGTLPGAEPNSKAQNLVYVTTSDTRFTKSNLPALLLLNPEGKVMVSATARADGGAIKTGTANEKVGASLESNALGGRLEVYGKDDEHPVFHAEGGGAFIMNDQGTPVLGLTRGLYGGKLIIGNQAGDATVEAGTLDNGRGVVRAYPLGGATPIPIPHFIEGWGGSK